jgi:ATP/maltotriose-dependent transcriptional regulator MalT
VSRGEEAYANASEMGDPTLSFSAAGGTAMAHLDLGDVDAAGMWLDRAAAIASANPTPLRARRMETWRGLAAAAAGDADGMRTRLEKAAALANDDGRSAPRCEALSHLAWQSVRLGVERNDPALVDLAERAATELLELAPALSGHPPWPAQADAVIATAALFRGDEGRAAEFARSAQQRLMGAMQEDLHLTILLPVARVMRDVGAPEAADALGFARYAAGMIAQRTLDESVRVRWFRGPIGRELTDLIGPSDLGTGSAEAVEGESGDDALMQSLIEGKTNAEIADALGIGEDDVARRLGELFAKIGASSRAEATAFAFRESVS